MRLVGAGHPSPGAQIGGTGLSFAPDGRSLVAQDPDRALRIVETATGRTLARLEAQPFATSHAAFSPDGTYLAVSTGDGPAVLTWDLRAIRRRSTGWAWTGAPCRAANPTRPQWRRHRCPHCKSSWARLMAMTTTGITCPMS